MSITRHIVDVLTDSSQLLTTLATVKDELGIFDASEDARLTRRISAASSAIRRHLNRETMGKQRVVEKVAAFGDLTLMLSRVPIIGTVEKIEIRGALITDFEVEDRLAGFLFRENGWQWEPDLAVFSISESILARSENPNFEVTYSGGFFLPGDVGQTADDIVLPPEIEEAAIMTVKDWQRAKDVDHSITQHRAADASITFASGGQRMGIPIEALELIEFYRLAA